MGSEFFKSLAPIDSEFHKLQIANRKTQLLGLLARPNLPEHRKPKIQRLLWVIIGALDHGISMKRLFKVSKTYERIGMVPQGYNQAELYLQTKEPHHF